MAVSKATAGFRGTPLTTTAFYGNPSLSTTQFQRNGLGMWGGLRGTYGKYEMGPVTTVADMKNERERQSGE